MLTTKVLIYIIKIETHVAYWFYGQITYIVIAHEVSAYSTLRIEN